MSLGLGIASTRSDKNSASDSFGLISLCSIGPILCVLLLGIIYQPQEAASHLSIIPTIPDTANAAQFFITALPTYFEEVARALLPIAGMFLVFQAITRRFKRGKLMRIATGLLYTLSYMKRRRLRIPSSTSSDIRTSFVPLLCVTISCMKLLSRSLGL